MIYGLTQKLSSQILSRVHRGIKQNLGIRVTYNSLYNTFDFYGKGFELMWFTNNNNIVNKKRTTFDNVWSPRYTSQDKHNTNRSFILDFIHCGIGNPDEMDRSVELMMTLGMG